MGMSGFYKKLESAWKKTDSMVCVGLDPSLKKIPARFQIEKNPVFAFNRAIIEATAPYACAFKPQVAYYAGQGLDEDLRLTINFIRNEFPEHVIVFDAKRGDIGSTAEMYAEEAFTQYGADSVTVNPYMGGDTLEPFLKFTDKGTIVLCRTSNPGSGDFQSLEIGGHKLYQIVAEKAAREWNTNHNLALVVGATYPKELADIRAIVGNMPLLVPGIGAQGGDVEAAVNAGKDENGFGMMINSSRGIIYAGETKEDWATAARTLSEEIKRYS